MRIELVVVLGALGLVATATACGIGASSSTQFELRNGDDVVGPEIDDEPGPGRDGPPPDYGTTVRAADPPPPISGGTLIVSHDGKTAVAADPDRDRVYVVDLGTQAVTSIALVAHDEPGRLVEDGAGRVHVALRSGGAVATIDLASGTLLARRSICAAPRGIAYDGAGSDDQLVVACDTGEIMTLAADPSNAQATTLATLDRGLRDVVMNPAGGFWVSRFRTAEILSVSTTGAVDKTLRPDGSIDGGEATLGWRMIASPDAAHPDPLLVHEIASSKPVQTRPGGYGSSMIAPSDCSGGGEIVDVALMRGQEGPVVLPSQIVLPVDMAADGTRYAFVSAGNGHTAALPQLVVITGKPPSPAGPCGAAAGPADLVGTVDGYMLPGQPIAVAIGHDGQILVQSREPAALFLPSGPTVRFNGNPLSDETYTPTLKTIALATESREDTGHAIFHSNSGAGIACASCHGEGGDDGHVWTFDTVGARRTPSLRGTLNGTAPYHWGGEMSGLTQLTQEVLTGRMSGPSLASDQVDALQGWLFALPAPATGAVDRDSADRGKALFESNAVGCAGCHAGPMLTNSATVDVGTGGAFQVPSLVGVAARTPLLHDGCATTLADRFGSCATPQHGRTSQLSTQDVADLVSYLRTL